MGSMMHFTCFLRTRYLVCPFTDEETVGIIIRGYLLYLIGVVFFPTKCQKLVHERYVAISDRVTTINSYSWGFYVLSYLYHYLGEAAKPATKHIGGSMTLLLLWPYGRLLPGHPRLLYDYAATFHRARAWAYISKNIVSSGSTKFKRENSYHHIFHVSGYVR